MQTIVKINLDNFDNIVAFLEEGLSKIALHL